MAFTDKQKATRYELENRQTPLSPAERLLLAALNDLKEADESGKNIPACEKAAEQAQKAVDNESKNENERELPEAISAGGDDVRRVQENQGSKEKTVDEEKQDKKKSK